MNFYAKCMRNGSLILFWMAIIIAVMTLASVATSYWNMMSSVETLPYRYHSGSNAFNLLLAFGSELSAAVWPFFGAPLLNLEERRGGKESVSPCIFRCSPYH